MNEDDQLLHIFEYLIIWEIREDKMFRKCGPVIYGAKQADDLKYDLTILKSRLTLHSSIGRNTLVYLSSEDMSNINIALKL